MKTSVASVNSTAILNASKPTGKPGRPRTMVTLKRVVLLNGKPVGQGRPSKDGKGTRTVVFIPVSEKYNAAKHGTGVKYSAALAQFKAPIKRMPLKTFVKLTSNGHTAPAPKSTTPAPAAPVTEAPAETSAAPTTFVNIATIHNVIDKAIDHLVEEPSAITIPAAAVAESAPATEAPVESAKA